MKRSKAFLLPLLALASISLFSVKTACAQAPASSDEVDSNPQFWQASFGNGGHYLVKMNTIVSASKHEYISDGVARVVEVTIGNSSAVVARFYYFEAVLKDTPIAAGQTIINRVEDVNKQVAGRVAPAAGKLQVVKNYPVSTHSHTVEYALQSEAALGSLYTSLMSAIHTGKGRTWREPAPK
ncbi:MAG: hypothetical protein ACAI34_06360 [Verrucomicrobium sp.]